MKRSGKEVKGWEGVVSLSSRWVGSCGRGQSGAVVGVVCPQHTHRIG